MATHTGHNKYGRRRRKKRLNTNKLLLLVCVILIVVVLVILGVKLFGSDKEDKVETLVPESELTENVSVNGINITGMGHTEALAAIEKKYKWNLKVRNTDNGEVFEVENLIEGSIEKALNTIYSAAKPESSYTVIFEPDKELLEGQIEQMKTMWNSEPKNGAISGFDKENNVFTYSDSVDGRVLDEDKLKNDIISAINNQKTDSTVNAQLVAKSAEISAAQAKEMYKTIGQYITKSTANADRNHNLDLACKAIDGTLLQVGEEFSFNLKTGNRTPEAGYRAAGAYQNGLVVQEPGGGVCQVASTLYNAVIFSGLDVTERHSHTFEPSYVTPGEDATVSYDGYAGPDLRFTNTSSSAIVIRAVYSKQTVTCTIIGIPILEEGKKIAMRSEKNSETDIPAPIFEADETMEIGAYELVSEGTKGSTWTTYLVITEPDGTTHEEFFHTSIYKGHNPVIKKHPESPEVASISTATGTEGESTGSDESTSETNGEHEIVDPMPSSEATQPGPGDPSRGPGGSSSTGPGGSSGGSGGSSGGPGSGSSDNDDSGGPGSQPKPAPGGLNFIEM